VEKLVWVPVISLCKIFIPSYMFDGLWWQMDHSPPQSRELYRYLSKLTYILCAHFQQPCKLQPHTIWDVILAHYFAVVVYYFCMKEERICLTLFHFQDMAIQRVFKYLSSTFCDDVSSLDIMHVSFCWVLDRISIIFRYFARLSFVLGIR
jgi:hypothetical protein